MEGGKHKRGGRSADRIGQVQKWCFQLQKGSVKGKGLLQCFLSLMMNVEEFANTHAMCFERITRVLEVIFLIILHYGVWGHCRLVSELWLQH